MTDSAAQAPLRPRPRGRFAPSPTGPLHTGSLVAAVGSYLMARRNGGEWLLRIDDLDTPRCRKTFENDILRTLERFCLYWDGPVEHQSNHQEQYQEAFNRLVERDILYPCGCSRTDIARIASAPHPGEEIPYPGTCRGGLPIGKEARTWRVRVDDVRITYADLRHGIRCIPLDDGGDFIIRRGDGFYAYMLAVVVDDYLAGVNQVIRGDDLLPSTPRQVYLHQLLGWPVPTYGHLPLVTAPGGGKLSKRDNLVSLAVGSSTVAGDESQLMTEALGFLGCPVPIEMEGAPCTELLPWALSRFAIKQS